MTKLELPLTNDENKWLSDWATMAGYKNNEDGIREVLKVVGAIPKGSAYWKEHFEFAE